MTNPSGAKITFTQSLRQLRNSESLPGAAAASAEHSPIPPQDSDLRPVQGFQDPLTYDWNLAVEQQLTTSLSVRARLCGRAQQARVGGHRTQSHCERHARLQSSRLRGDQQLLPATITEANTGGNTNYNSLQISAEQRVRYGLTLLFNYTWSKALNNMPWNQAATSIGAGNSYVYPITVPNFKGSTTARRTSIIATSSRCPMSTPCRSSCNDAPAAVRYMVNGWETTGLFEYRSGDPLTIFSSSSNNSGSGQKRDRAVFRWARLTAALHAPQEPLQVLSESRQLFRQSAQAPSETSRKVLLSARTMRIGTPALRAISRSASGPLCSSAPNTSTC